MKPYQQVPIVECCDPLISIPLEQFAVEHPHPYVKVGAPYGNKSPYYLRQGVLERLLEAQRSLQQMRPGWRLQIFDAYRPIAVQRYMVDYTFAQLLADRRLVLEQLTDAQQAELWAEVHQFWAVPSDNPATPPPHSTGAAVDLTLVDAIGTVVNMGSPIDEISPRSHPNFFAEPNRESIQGATELLSEAAQLEAHHNRQLLKQVMATAGFQQHPNEWWHFSLGDQMWAWLINQSQPSTQRVACYGAIEPGG
ncbi:MAG: M15 family metallopeptidase [Elainellaceae cyanobacterium]